MLSVKQLVTIDSQWTAMPPLQLGKIPAGFGTADLFVTISDGDRALLRVHLYGDSSSEIYTFQDALVWCERVFVGFGHRVYVIDPKQRLASEIFLGTTCGYFGAFYAGQDYLLVASGERLLRLAPDGRILWSTPNLGLDGVDVKSVENGLVQGEGEWDPPGGWKPFVTARLRRVGGWLTLSGDFTTVRFFAFLRVDERNRDTTVSKNERPTNPGSALNCSLLRRSYLHDQR